MSCPYCAFFQLMIGTMPDETGKFTPYLRIRQAFERMGVSDKHALGQAPLVEITTKDKLLPWGYIVKAADEEGEETADEDQSGLQLYKSRTPGIFGRNVPPMLDVTLINTWLGFCKEHHEDTCASQSTLWPGLQLLDCENRALVKAAELADPDLEYAVLSYVRPDKGEKQADYVQQGVLTHQIPKVFADAISVTKQIGLRYLWIDICCSPTEASERTHQMSNIGEILGRATVTLISATDDSIGLPGISAPREEQLSLKIDAGLFTTSLLRPDLDVAGSKWASQAITFQEGLLSRRRLVFTTSQIYFQCQALHCHESIAVSLHLAPGLNLGRVFPSDAGTKPGDIKNMIAAYISRDSSSPEERLDAFRGVLRHYQQMPKSVDNLLGVPLFHTDDFNNTGIVSHTDHLAVGLGWLTTRDVSGHVYHESYGLQGGFPSWTWLSWQLKNRHRDDGSGFRFSMVDDSSPGIDQVSAVPRMEISVGFEDGVVRSWEIDRHAIMQKAARLSFLRLTTLCFDIDISEEAGTAGSPPKLNVNCNLPVGAREKVLSWFRSTRWPRSDDADRVSSETPMSLNEKPLPNPLTNGVSEGDEHALQQAQAEHHSLLGVLLSGRGWKGEAHDCAVTVLVCARRDLEQNPEAPLTRLGAMQIPYDTFDTVDEERAILQGVETGPNEKNFLELEMREVDLY